jgi:hypothetical protein
LLHTIWIRAPSHASRRGEPSDPFDLTIAKLFADRLFAVTRNEFDAHAVQKN